MRKILIVAAVISIASCKSEDKKEADTKATTTEVSSNLPYTADYSSKFEMGDAKNSETILKAWKYYEDGNLQTARTLFADSMHLYLRDGTVMVGQTDSLFKGVQSYRDMFASVKNSVHAYFPIRSTDKGENWVCIWGTEVDKDKQGKVDSVSLQETWRLNKDGKIDLMYQYGAATAPPVMSK